MLPEDVTSSGAVTAARAAFELATVRVMDRAVSRFMRDIYDDAAAAWDSPTVLAAASPDPFTLGQLLARWAPVVDALSGNLARAAGAAASSAFMGRVQRRLRDSALPLSVYEATKRVLAEALADPSGRPNRTQLKAALRRELVPRADSPWRAQGERIARTETTAVFNLAVENKLREDGTTYKRWVAHHDGRTRPTHARASGQTVPTDQPFLVGGWSMMGPGDPAAPDSETANCRCVVAGVNRPETETALPHGLDTLTAASPAEFHAAFEDAFRGSPYANHVNHYTAQELDGMTPLLTPDGKAGLVVHDHGDGRIEATALFNQSGRQGVGASLLSQSVADYNVNYVECFGPYLNKLYEKVGFTVTDRFPFDPAEAPVGWDYKRFDNPDYYLLKWGGSAVTAAAGDPILTVAEAAELWRQTVVEVEADATPEQATYLDEQRKAAETQV